MNIKKLLVRTVVGIILLLLFAWLAVVLFSKDSNYITKKHGSIRVFSADLNHDGIIDESEKNLTWEQSFDELLKQAGNFKQLKSFRGPMNIKEKDESIACKLIRYEILHQCEELIMKSGVVVPVKTNSLVAKKKKHLMDIYFDPLSVEHFDRMYSEKNKYIRIINGGPVTSLDQVIISDFNSHTKLLTTMAGLKRYKFDGKENDELENCLALVLKTIDDEGKIIYYVFLGKYVCNSDEKDNLPEFFEKVELKEEKVIEATTKNNKKIVFNKEKDVYWQDKEKITSDDFIWSWNRAVNPLTKTPFADQFYAIDGYDEQRKKNIDESKKTFDFYNGMKGLEKISNSFFKIHLTKYCPYFDCLLTNINFFPAPRHKMTENTGKENEKIKTGWWQDVEKICGCGPFKIKKINNVVNGVIELEKNENYCFEDEVKINGFTFELVVSQTIAERKYDRDDVSYIDIFDRSVLDLKNPPEDLFYLKHTLCSKYIIFNVNRYSTFDHFIDKTYEGISDENREKIRQKMTKIIFLLINRYDIGRNISRVNDDSLCGVVCNFMIEECVPEKDESGGIVAKRVNGKLEKAFWYERSRSEEFTNEEEDEEVFNVVDKKKYKIKTTHFKSNFFCQRSIKSDISDKADVYTYFDDKYKEHSDEKSSEVQKKNFEKAKELAEEIGIKYQNDKFVNFPQINYTSITLQNNVIFEIKYHLSLFGIEINISNIDTNAGFTYQDVGLYEYSATGWSPEFFDPITWIIIFESGNGSNFFFTGAKD